MISLVSKFEERKLNELELDLNKTRHFFSTKKKIYPVENLVFNYIERLINKDYSKDEISILNKLLNALQNVNGGNLVYEMTANIALNRWATNKISINYIPLLN